MKIEHREKIHQYGAKDFPFKVVLGRLGENYQRHSHEFNELFIVTRGTAMHNICEKLNRISSGDVYIIKDKNIYHSFDTPVELELYNFIFDNSFLDNLGSDVLQMEGYQSLFVLEPFFALGNGYRNSLSLSFGNLSIVHALCEQLLEEYQLRKPGYKTIIKALFTDLVVLLSRFYIHSTNQVTTSKTYRLGKAIAYMEKNFTRQISIKTLATISFLSERQFTRLFHECFHVSPSRYIIQLRLKQAVRLLDNSNMDIKEIAYSCGFNDPNYFTRKFSEILGVSPSKYKTQLLSGLDT